MRYNELILVMISVKFQGKQKKSEKIEFDMILFKTDACSCKADNNI